MRVGWGRGLAMEVGAVCDRTKRTGEEVTTHPRVRVHDVRRRLVQQRLHEQRRTQLQARRDGGQKLRHVLGVLDRLDRDGSLRARYAAELRAPVEA